MRAMPVWKTTLSSRSAQALAAAAGLLALAGCAEMPVGPTVTVMPGPNKPFEVFVADDRLCRDWALSSSGGQGSDAAAQRFASAQLQRAQVIRLCLVADDDLGRERQLSFEDRIQHEQLEQTGGL